MPTCARSPGDNPHHRAGAPASARAEAARLECPLLLAAARCAIELAEVRGWSAATVTGVFYGLKAVLDGQTGDGLVPLSQVRRRVRPRSHSLATRIAKVLSELGLLHDDTTAAIRAWIDYRTGELPAGVWPRCPCLAGGAARR